MRSTFARNGWSRRVCFISAPHSVWARYSVTLLRNQGGKVSVGTGVRAYFISQFGKYVPGKVWVILLRMSILGRSLGITRTAVGITAMYEALVSIGRWCDHRSRVVIHPI